MGDDTGIRLRRDSDVRFEGDGAFCGQIQFEPAKGGIGQLLIPLKGNHVAVDFGAVKIDSFGLYSHLPSSSLVHLRESGVGTPLQSGEQQGRIIYKIVK